MHGLGKALTSLEAIVILTENNTFFGSLHLMEHLRTNCILFMRERAHEHTYTHTHA